MTRRSVPNFDDRVTEIISASSEQVPAFVSGRRERFHIPTRYVTDEYVGLLRTDSLVTTLNPESRAQFPTTRPRY
jgi:hypothetical protein